MSCVEVAQGSGVAQSSLKAFELLRRAARSNYPPAIFQLGYLHRHSPYKRNNPQKAVKLYEQAANAGYVPAETALGMCYAEGLGVPKDTSQAIK